MHIFKLCLCKVHVVLTLTTAWFLSRTVSWSTQEGRALGRVEGHEVSAQVLGYRAARPRSPILRKDTRKEGLCERDQTKVYSLTWANLCGRKTIGWQHWVSRGNLCVSVARLPWVRLVARVSAYYTVIFRVDISLGTVSGHYYAGPAVDPEFFYTYWS